MVSWTGHIVPFIVTVAIWFIATGLIAWADNRESATFSKSLAVGAAGGLLGLVLILVASLLPTVGAVYVAFVGALLVWAWHEISFLTGTVAGPRRGPSDPSLTGLARFRQASATVMHHEVALALTALVLISLSWDAPNQIGATVFVLLFALRLTSKINLFVGVPNSTSEMLPDQLAYLKTYFGPCRMTVLLALSIVGIGAVTAWFGALALAAPVGSAEMVGASLLFTLCLLGALEHLFLALPFRDGMLWGWALPKRAAPKHTAAAAPAAQSNRN